MKIGILAGTFDPIHNGHIALAEQARNAGKLDEVVLLVERQPRRKKPIVGYEQRLEMGYAAGKKLPWLKMHEMPFDNFSIQSTWPILQSVHRNDQLVMIMGIDVFEHLPQWPNVDLLIDSAKFIVAPRGDSDEELIENIALEIGAEFMIVKNPLPRLSSTFVRQQLKSGDYTNLPELVAKYIAEQKLYDGKSSEKA